MEAPATVAKYMCSVTISIIPKFFLILVASGVAAYRVELYSAIFLYENDARLPTTICFYEEDDFDEYRGDRICNNAIAAAVCTVIAATMLIVLDLFIPCLKASFSMLAALFNIILAVLMGIHWIVTGALLVDLYNKHCDDQENGCDEIDRKFIALYVMSFICAGGWGIVVLHSIARPAFN